MVLFCYISNWWLTVIVIFYARLWKTSGIYVTSFSSISYYSVTRPHRSCPTLPLHLSTTDLAEFIPLQVKQGGKFIETWLKKLHPHVFCKGQHHYWSWLKHYPALFVFYWCPSNPSPSSVTQSDNLMPLMPLLRQHHHHHHFVIFFVVVG